MCEINWRIKFEDYKKYLLLSNKLTLKSQQRFNDETRNAYTEEINKIVLSNNEDKRLQTFDKIRSYSYGT